MRSKIGRIETRVILVCGFSRVGVNNQGCRAGTRGFISGTAGVVLVSKGMEHACGIGRVVSAENTKDISTIGCRLETVERASRKLTALRRVRNREMT